MSPYGPIGRFGMLINRTSHKLILNLHAPFSHLILITCAAFGIGEVKHLVAIAYTDLSSHTTSTRMLGNHTTAFAPWGSGGRVLRILL